MNQILWGTREKWINDPAITPAAFETDVIMLNSMVDELMSHTNLEYQPMIEGEMELAQKGALSTPLEIEKGNLLDCAGYHTLVYTRTVDTMPVLECFKEKGFRDRQYPPSGGAFSEENTQPMFTLHQCGMTPHNQT
jgi:hypothetical protein